MENINVTIDGIKVSVPKGSTVLDAAKAAGVHVPTLCYMEGHKPLGACRVCLVEVEGGAAGCRRAAPSRRPTAWSSTPTPAASTTRAKP